MAGNTVSKESRVVGLFQNLIWPAAAGNVAWAFFTVAIKPTTANEAVIVNYEVKFLVLLFLALYLGADWFRTEGIRKELKPGFWLADTPLALSIVIFSIATAESNLPWAKWSLAAIFGTAILGHLSGAWEPAGKVDWPERRRMAGVNTPGIAAVLLGNSFLPATAAWHLPVAVGMVVAFWIAARRRQLLR